MGIRMKSMILCGIVAITIIGAVTAVALLDARNAEMINNERYVESELELATNNINAFFNENIAIVESIEEMLTAAIENDHFQVNTFNTVLRNLMEKNDIIYGAWIRLEDPRFAEEETRYTATGVYDPYFYREGDRIEYVGLEAAGWLDDEVEGAFYYDTYRSGEIHLYEPVVWEIDGQDVEMVTIAYPVIVNGSVEGALAIDIETTDINEYISGLTIYETGHYQLIFDQQYETNHFMAFNEIAPAYELGHDLGWRLYVDIPPEEMRDYRERLIKISIVGAVGIVIAVLLLNLLLKNILEPITYLTEKVQQMSSYDFTGREDEKSQQLSNRKDEIGAIAGALITMKQNIVELIKGINDNAMQLTASSEELNATSHQVSMSATEVSKTIEEISKGAVEQAENTEDGALRIRELEERIEKDIQVIEGLNSSSEQVYQMRQEGEEIIQSVVEKTGQSNQAISGIRQVITNTNESAHKIQSASQMIESIAEQTNLLALNAAIEAARAGESGRGFAVVAEEIRKLAEQSNQFAQEIDTVIGDLTEQTEGAVKTVEEVAVISKEQSDGIDGTSEKFAGIEKAIDEMRGKIEDLNDSAMDMRRKKDEIVGVIENLSAISEENAAGTEEASASVEEQTAAMNEIAQSSENLAEMAEEMKDAIQRFKI
ncbi:methyl-accepting chemotaxis protein [Tindallia magadiensis]|uniref:Methyl-accepting chemotaxis protein n=1 Tax=Tindallia magadiensis TaxID=69895 RepID=A0A1I3C0B8_9FIRM|nr:methyl-accepting chemotaxis protein [Tindallia magadiensis]SFH67649.1 methyl-accepting chemotaxis protein [Tindallia magadiensis]